MLWHEWFLYDLQDLLATSLLIFPLLQIVHSRKLMHMLGNEYKLAILLHLKFFAFSLFTLFFYLLDRWPVRSTGLFNGGHKKKTVIANRWKIHTYK